MPRYRSAHSLSQNRLKAGKPGWLAWLICALCLLLFALWLFQPGWGAPAGWKLIVCDVGQGSAALVRTTPDSAVLVDTGSAGTNLKGCMNWAGIKRLDAIFLSHEHEDHYGNITVAASYLEANGTIFCPPSMASNCDFGTGRKSQTLSAGQGLHFNHLEVELLWPVPQNQALDVDWDNKNNHSLVLKTDNGISALLPADAEEAVLEHIGQELEGKSIDVLVVPHHGSKTSGSTFFSLFSYRVAAISAGKDNSYGHPHKLVLTALNSQQKPYFITYDRGHLAFTGEDQEVQVYAEG